MLQRILSAIADAPPWVAYAGMPLISLFEALVLTSLYYEFRKLTPDRAARMRSTFLLATLILAWKVVSYSWARSQVLQSHNVHGQQALPVRADPGL